ncbi:uncharacterized protein LOC144163035 isoform X2 [Haemaphysalis longicornis]
MGPDLDSEAGAGSQRAVDATPPPPVTSSGPPNPCDDVTIVTPPPRKVLVVDLTGSGGDTFTEVYDTKIMGSRRKKRKSPCSGEEVGAQKPVQFRAPKQERLEPEESRGQGGSPSVSHLTRPNDVVIKKEMLEESRAVHNAEVDGTSVDAAQCAGPSQGAPRLPGTPSCTGHRDGAAESAGSSSFPLSEAEEKEVIILDDSEDHHGLVSGGEGHRPATTAALEASVRGGGSWQADLGPSNEPQVSGPREADEQKPSNCGSGGSTTTPSGESSADSSLPMTGNPKLAGKHGQMPWDTYYRGRGQRNFIPTRPRDTYYRERGQQSFSHTRPWNTHYRGRGQRRVIDTASRCRTSTGPASTNYQQAQPSVSKRTAKALAKHLCHREHASVCEAVCGVPNAHPLLSRGRVCPWKKHRFAKRCSSDGTQAAEGDNVVLTASEPATSGLLEVSEQPWSKKRKRLVEQLRSLQPLPRLQACLSNWMAAMRRCELCAEELDDLNLCSIQTGHQTDQEVQSSAPNVNVDALVEAIETGVFPVDMYPCLWHAVCCPIGGAQKAAPTTSCSTASPRVESVQLTEGESSRAGTAATGSASSPDGEEQFGARISSRPDSWTTDVSEELAGASTAASSASAANLPLVPSGENKLVKASRGEDRHARHKPSKRPAEEGAAQEGRRSKKQKKRRQRSAEGVGTAGASRSALEEDPSRPLPSLEAAVPSGGPTEPSGENKLVKASRGEDRHARHKPSKRPAEEGAAQEARRSKQQKKRRQRIAEGVGTAGASRSALEEDPSRPLPSLEAAVPSGGPTESAGPSQGAPRLPGTPSCTGHRDGAAESAGSSGFPLSQAEEEEVIPLDNSEDYHGLVSGGGGHRPAITAALEASGSRSQKRESPCSGEEVGAQKPGQFRSPKQEHLEPEESRSQAGIPKVSNLTRPNDVLIEKEMLEESRAVHNAEVDGTSVDAAQNAGPSQGAPRLPGTPSCPGHRDGAAESAGSGGSPLSEAGCGVLSRTERPADGVLQEEEVIPLDNSENHHGLVSGGGGHRPATTAALEASGSRSQKRESLCSGEEVGAQKPGQFRSPKQERLEPEESRWQAGSPRVSHLTRPNDVLIEKEMLEESRAVHNAEVDGTSVDAAQSAGPSKEAPRLPVTPSCPGHRDGAAEIAGSGGSPLSEGGCGVLSRMERPSDGVLEEKEVIILDDSEDHHGLVSGGEGHRPATTAALEASGSRSQKRESPCSREEVGAQKPGQFRSPKQERLEPEESRWQAGSPRVSHLTRPNDVLIEKEMLEESRAVHNAEVDGTSVDAAQSAGPSKEAPRLPVTPSCPGHRDGAAEIAGSGGSPLSEGGCGVLSRMERPSDGVLEEKEVIILDDSEDHHGLVSGGEGHRPATTAALEASGSRSQKRESPCSGEEVGAQKPGQFRSPKQERLEPEESRWQAGSPRVSHLTRPNDVLIEKEMLEESRAVHNAEVDGTSVAAAQSAGPSQGAPRLPRTPSCPGHRDGAAESAGSGGYPLSEAGFGVLSRTERPADGVLEEEVIPLDNSEDHHGLVSGGGGHRPAITAALEASSAGPSQGAPKLPRTPSCTGHQDWAAESAGRGGSPLSEAWCGVLSRTERPADGVLEEEDVIPLDNSEDHHGLAPGSLAASEVGVRQIVASQLAQCGIRDPLAVLALPTSSEKATETATLDSATIGEDSRSSSTTDSGRINTSQLQPPSPSWEIPNNNTAVVAVRVFPESIYYCYTYSAFRSIYKVSRDPIVEFKGGGRTLTSLEVYMVKTKAEYVFVASLEGELLRYDPNTGGGHTDRYAIGGGIRCSALSGACIYLGLDTGEIAAFDIKSGKKKSYGCFMEAVTCIKAERQQKLLCAASDRGDVAVYTNSGDRLWRFDRNQFVPTCIGINKRCIYVTTVEESLYKLELPGTPSCPGHRDGAAESAGSGGSPLSEAGCGGLARTERPADGVLEEEEVIPLDNSEVHHGLNGILQGFYACKGRAVGIDFYRDYIIHCSQDSKICAYRIKDEKELQCKLVCYGAEKNNITCMDVRGNLVATGNADGKWDVVELIKRAAAWPCERTNNKATKNHLFQSSAPRSCGS